MDKSGGGLPPSVPKFITPTFKKAHFPNPHSQLVRAKDTLNFQPPLKGTNLSRVPFIPSKNKAPLKDIINKTPCLRYKPTEAFEKIVMESPLPNLSRISSITSEYSVSTPGQTEKLAGASIFQPFREKNFNSKPFSSNPDSQGRTREKNPRTKVDKPFGGLGIGDRCEGEGPVKNTFFPASELDETFRFSNTSTSRIDRGSTPKQFDNTPNLTENSDFSALAICSGNRNPGKGIPAVVDTIPNPPALHINDTFSINPLSGRSTKTSKTVNYGLDQRPAVGNLGDPRACFPPVSEPYFSPVKITSDLYVDEVSFNANLFDTSTDNAAGEFQETRPSLEAIADRQPECEAGSSQPHSGSTDDATLVPDKDSSLDSILPFKISASSRFQASKTKPKAKPKLPCDKLNLQANVKPKKSGKPALKERAQGLRKVAKKTAPVTAVMKKEKDGFLITTTRSGRQSHRPLKLWENEKGPKPEVSIKYNFMTFGVSITKNGVTSKMELPAFKCKKSTGANSSMSLPRGAHSVYRKRNGTKGTSAVSNKTKPTPKNLCASDADHASKPNTNLATPAPSRNPRKRIRRVSLANQSLGIISPGILLPPKKATRAKLKALPKRPLKEIPAKVTSKKPAKTSKLTATLNDALQGKASDLFRVQTQLSDSFSTQSSASPDPRYEFSD